MTDPRFPVELLMTHDSPLGQLMAATDWPATALGPFGDWPPELRTAVSVCLNSPFPILVMWGPQLAMVYNDAFAPILGTKHPALGLPCQQVWADAWPVVGDMLTRVLDHGEPTYHQDLRLILQRHGFDEEVYFTFAYSPIPRADGAVGGVFTVVTETTGQVLSARRMRALQELSASRSAHTASVAGACATAMAVLGAHRADLPFGVTYLLDDAGGGARAMASFGLADPALLPAELPSPRPGGDGDWTGLAARLPGLARPGASPAGDADIDIAVPLPLAAPGQSRVRGTLLLGVSRYLRLDDDYRGFLELVVRQVTAVVSDAEAYAVQRRRTEELAELDRAKTEFFTSVSHELRTPLALIAGPASDALADAEHLLPPAQRRRLEIIHRNAGRLRRMVDTLLDLARIEDGRLAPGFAAVELGELTRGVAESFSSAVDRAGLAFTVDCPSLAYRVLVDPDMWEKITLNLLSNAVKFTLAGAIRISLRGADDVVELRVSDTGVGIADDQVTMIFERFHQVRDTGGRSHEGSGIGLALVRELAALHGGTVDVASRAGEGSTFTVRIPARRAEGPGAPALSPESAGRYVDEARQWSAPVPGAAAPGEAGRDAVLIAEDNADMRQYLTDLFQRRYVVAVAANGQEALQRARAARPDLVLTDISMPGLDGFGLLRALRADPETARIPVIFLSARAGEESAIEGLAAGADDYLVKPFSSAELLARVRSNLDLARVRARAYEEQRQVALALQRSILGPVNLPAGLAVRYEPAGASLEIGGDWYDVVELPGGQYGVVVGDVVGRGLAAAAIMGQLRSAGRALLLENNGPSRVLRALDQFSALIPGADCTTVFCAIIDPRGGAVRYSNAGHLPALVTDPDGTVRRLEHATAPALAVAGDLDRPEVSVELPGESTLLLYTDGLVERRGEVIDTGIERAAAALAESRHLGPEQVADHLTARLVSDKHTDDVAFLVYRQGAGRSY